MTVGFFIDEYLPKLHGDITSTIALRAALEAMGHVVYIIAPAEPKFKDNDAHVIRVPSFDPKVLRYKTRLALLYPGLAKKLAKYKFDIVHSQTQFGMGVLAHETAKTLGVPHVSTMHSVFAETASYNQQDALLGLALISVIYPLYFRSMPKYNWARPEGAEDWMRIKEQAWWASSIFLNSCDAVVAPSAHIATSLKEHGLTQECQVLPNGLDSKNFQKAAKAAPPKDIPVKGKDIWFVCVGRVAAEKRPQVLLEAMRHVPDPHTKLLIVGAGPQDERLAGMAVDYGLQERVYLLGRREPGVVPSILAHSDVFVLPSYRFDNQPMVVLEAMAAGLPIIYCDDRLTEGLTKKNAMLTDTPGPESFAKAMAMLADDAKKRASMAKAAAQLLPQFDVAVYAEKIEALYAGVIERKAAKASATLAEQPPKR